MILGEHSRLYAAESNITVTVSVSRLVTHPDYGGVKNTNDIALVQLASSADIFTFTPVCLPPAGADYTGQLATVAG